jgi:hypothetical protein
MANEKRLIDANPLIEMYSGGESMKSISESIHDEGFVHALRNAPTVDAVEVVHGRWEKAHISGYLKCNCCKDAFIYEEWLESGKWNYCPNCGADMRGDEDD